ncbi:uncharacterized protein (TIGR02001 family) [Pseudoduganella lurida]|uniref:Uncharacterized protein (TIGR02001 family) n=1 Tax=Pseudoduganella lurida TaxID=1036180 RepID=A0A562REM9_9BURK|nr:TorF family putative porin [Pseudoduganella lurida]TWI67478.1 uncharacterized protein (TIGR02001 family) [Pseudoduganella lurida]
MHVRRIATLTLLACTALLAGTAHAQWSGSAALTSSYRLRGIDLSEGGPSVQGGVAYDAADGWYAGGFAARTHVDGATGAQLLVYGGRAQRLADGFAWDAGISASHATRGGYGSYQELYAGLSRSGAAGSAGLRVAWSPRYRPGDARIVYLQLEASRALGRDLDAFLRGGILTTLSGTPPPERSDWRAGISARFGSARVQLAYEHTQRRGFDYGGSHDYAHASRGTPHAFIASIGTAF